MINKKGGTGENRALQKIGFLLIFSISRWRVQSFYFPLQFCVAKIPPIVHRATPFLSQFYFRWLFSFSPHVCLFVSTSGPKLPGSTHSCLYSLAKKPGSVSLWLAGWLDGWLYIRVTDHQDWDGAGRAARQELEIGRSRNVSFFLFPPPYLSLSSLPPSSISMCQFLLASVPSTYLTLGLAASGQKLDLVSELYFCRCLLQNVYRIKKKKSVHMCSLLYYIGNGMKGSAVLFYLLLTLFSNVCFFSLPPFQWYSTKPARRSSPSRVRGQIPLLPHPTKTITILLLPPHKSSAKKTTTQKSKSAHTTDVIVNQNNANRIFNDQKENEN